MSRVLVCLVACACTVVSHPASTQTLQGGVTGGISIGPQGPAGAGPIRTGTSRLRGRVLTDDTGLPIRSAVVRVSSSDLRGTRTTLTDDSGRYDLNNLPAGRYTIMATKAGYAVPAPGTPGREFMLGENHDAVDVDVYLPRGAVVTGRVVDDRGDPIANVQVSALRAQYRDGQRVLTFAPPPAATNDLGEFRLYGLIAGDYYLSASFPGLEGREPGARAYAPTYYPGTADPDAARRLSLAAGQTLTGITLTPVMARTVTISGTAVDDDGRPLRSGGVSVMRRSAGMMPGGATGGVIAEDGSFSISGIVPGEYLVRAMTQPGGPGPRANPPIAIVTVRDRDVTVRLAPRRPVTLRGRIVIDARAGAAGLRPQALRVRLQPVHPQDGMMVPGMMEASVRDDLTFEVQAPPVPVLVRVTTAFPMWGTTAIRLDGVDVTDAGIDLGAATRAAMLEIELTNRQQDVAGTVAPDAGRSAGEPLVVIFSRDRARWTLPSGRHVATARLERDRSFRVRGLPPGDYFAAAVRGITDGDARDPELLDRLRARATEVSLAEGDMTTINLAVIQR